MIGFVQKYVIRKTYRKFDARSRGGAFGVNIDGALYTSSEDYSLDIRYGLQPAILKRPAQSRLARSYGGAAFAPTADELQLFASLRTVAAKTSR